MTDDRDYRRQFYRSVLGGMGAEDRPDFYVPIYDKPEFAPFDVVSQMLDHIEFTANQSVQALSGLRACGKTQPHRMDDRDVEVWAPCMRQDV